MVKIALVLKNDILMMPRAPTHAHDALEHLEEEEGQKRNSPLICH
jgi:hypothetical protein